MKKYRAKICFKDGTSIITTAEKGRYSWIVAGDSARAAVDDGGKIFIEIVKNGHGLIYQLRGCFLVFADSSDGFFDS